MLTMGTWHHAWLVLLVIFSGGLVVSKLSEKARIPDVAAYLLYGILIGPAVLHWIQVPSQSEVNQFILNLGATLILFEGGRGVQLEMLKRVWLSISLLATLGIFVTAFVVGVGTHLLLHTPWMLSFLVGAVIAPTDPATLIPVFQRVPVLPKLQQTAESESAFNDATGTVLVVTLLAASAVGGALHWGSAALTFVESAGLSIVIGLAFGIAVLVLVSRRAWGLFYEFGSMVFFVAAIGAYASAVALHASGFMAAFVAGIIAGNGPAFGWSLEPHTEANVHHFYNVITFMMRMAIFVLLGAQVNFGLVHRYLWGGLAVVGLFMIVGRPMAVLASMLPDRRAQWQRRELGFMFWVRETGVIPAALAGMVVARGVAGGKIVAAITFLAILLTILIQASTTGVAARWLGVLVPEETMEDL